MSGWKNIIVEVYKAYDPQHVPFSFDQWWHSQSIGYQLDPSGSEPSVIILNLREGLADYPGMDTRFTVNLNTRRVIDKVTKSRVPVPQEVLPSLDEIEKYVRKTITNQKEAAERAVLARLERKRKAEEERAAQVHDFYGRLEEHGLWVPPQDSENDDYEDFQDTQCILCSSTLVNCLTCHRLCCCHSPVDDDPERTESDSEDSLEVPDTDEDDTKGCRAWCMDKLRTCVGHGQRSFCESCRGGKEGEAEKLLACPSCGTWECAEDLYWCIGRIPPQSAETDGSAGSLTPSSPEGTTGRHPPKHACSQCVKDGSADWMVCACIRCWSLQNAPLKGIVYKYVCRECSPKGDLASPRYSNVLAAKNTSVRNDAA
ncbi:hypothetical protein SCP_0505980 [Sparassis crispa]|uniref:Uncharacterized protein n=1 Tax=Sparassis crispa TaxID=139825 RepID=A0A401GP59_9APHY|nr:hypothetical protein SCP_0505980 [Sparassis crispa]GBE83544.1 hypothetical protein SCP_0505980 [Sparassis crispa]